jgi:hypothetical protein
MLTEWLMETASPVIRYRTLTELMQSTDTTLIQNTLAEVLALPQTQKRLDALTNLDYNYTHGADAAYLENVLPLLGDLGLYYGMEAFDRANKKCSDILPLITDAGYDKLVAYPFLLRAGFPVDALMKYAAERINTLYNFTRRGNYDIYDDAENYPGMPKAFRQRPVIKPAIASREAIRIPLIYDMVMLAAVYPRMPQKTKAKIDVIVNYVISNDYDIVNSGYGILCAEPRKYYAMGWDCLKPFNSNRYYANQNFQRLLLYAQFPTAIKTKWFTHAVDYMAQFRTAAGTYIFPASFFGRLKGNWVLGSHQSLSENKRKKNWLEIESTFHMRKLLSLMDNITEKGYARYFPTDPAYRTLFAAGFNFDPVL